MWDIKYQQDTNSLMYKTAFRPNGWDSSAGHLDGCNAS